MDRATKWVAVAALTFVSLLESGPLSAAPPNGGSIAFELKTADGGRDPAMPAIVDAASTALAAKGFVVLDDPAHAAYSAELIVDHTGVGTALGKAQQGNPVGVTGMGLSLSLPSGKSSVVPLQRTRLEIRIHKRGESEVVWQGAAVTVRQGGTKKGADTVVAADLCNALLGNYPAQPTELIGVP